MYKALRQNYSLKGKNMKYRYLAGLVALLLSGGAWAFGDSNQAQGQIQGQGQGQDQSQRQSNFSVTSTRTDTRQGQAQGNVGLGSGNSTTINQSYKEDYSETYDDYTPPAYAPPMGVSATCKEGISLGGGIPGVSVSGGGYITDEKCVEAETIRMGLQSGDHGNVAAANSLLKMRLDAALATRKQENEDEQVAQTLSRPAPTYAAVNDSPGIFPPGSGFVH